MSREAFTPGPWRVDPHHPGDIQTADGREVGSVWSEEDQGNRLTIRGHLVPDEQYKANAHLIAAAPAMYEALKAVQEVGLGQGSTERLGKLERVEALLLAALAQAEGRS